MFITISLSDGNKFSKYVYYSIYFAAARNCLSIKQTEHSSQLRSNYKIHDAKYFEKLIENYNRLTELPNEKFPILKSETQEKIMIAIFLFFNIVKR
jgi:hypothetical protein